MNLQTLQTELLKGAITLRAVLIGAVLALWFGIWRTKYERRFAAKQGAYERIFAAAEDVRFWVSETISDIHFLPGTGGKTAKELDDRYYEAQRVLSSYVHVGQLVISPKSRDKLEAFMRAVWDEQYRYREDDDHGDDEHHQFLSKHAHNLQGIIQEHLPELEKAARRDLR